MQPEVKQTEDIVQNKTETHQEESNKVLKENVQQEETTEQINWKKFRQQRDLERKQAEEVAKRAAEKEREAEALKAALDAVLNKPNVQQQQSYDPYYAEEEPEDQKIEKKVQEALLKREAEYEKRRQEEERKTFPQKLVQAHPDFDQVCNTSNLDYLEYHYPEVASAYKHMPDGFEKWSNIYRAVKRFVPSSNIRKEEIKADRNLNQPQSMSTMNMTSSGNPTPGNRIDEQKKMENWKRMQKLIKGVS